MVTYPAPRPCAWCGQTASVELTEAEVESFESGVGYIQDRLPRLSPEKREILITGTHPACWDEMFPEDDDEEDEEEDEATN